ncbi:30S ribosomal protein S18 [Nocardioides plantarum]|uniref:Small ribosomal subunit protein bS18 n=1 Tax=Nocardioides plantarum TaxID=29299 RepID=A0ABV5K7E4_9ACTN|nr:30S ribosomal protein S18 [Nocardioides plantarum]
MSDRTTRSRAPVVRRKRRSPQLHPGVASVDYKDVALLRTFVSDRGRIRARRITGVTPRQQRMVTRAIKNAREMALLPYSSHR